MLNLNFMRMNQSLQNQSRGSFLGYYKRCLLLSNNSYKHIIIIK